MTLKIDFKIKFKIINGCLTLNPTTFVRVIFRYHLYLRSYLRRWIKMAHSVYIKLCVCVCVCVCVYILIFASKYLVKCKRYEEMATLVALCATEVAKIGTNI